MKKIYFLVFMIILIFIVGCEKIDTSGNSKLANNDLLILRKEIIDDTSVFYYIMGLEESINTSYKSNDSRDTKLYINFEDTYNGEEVIVPITITCNEESYTFKSTLSPGSNSITFILFTDFLKSSKEVTCTLPKSVYIDSIYAELTDEDYSYYVTSKVEESKTAKYINNTPIVKVESTKEENYSTPLQSTKENNSTITIEDITWKETSINATEMYININAYYSKETPYDNSKDVNKYLKNDVVKVTATTDTGYYKIIGGTYIKKDFLKECEWYKNRAKFLGSIINVGVKNHSNIILYKKIAIKCSLL